MTTLIFLGTIISIFIFLIRLTIKIIKQKPIYHTVRTLVMIILSYSVLWSIFHFLSSDKVVPLGTDICFDDWCATITKIETPKTLGKENQLFYPHGQFIILHIEMSNHARGISQKPCEPRVHIIDEKGNYWSFSVEGQEVLEKLIGSQIPIDEKLELHESLETQLVFDLPLDAKKLKILIEEGPEITKLLFNENKKVFLIQ